MHSLKEKMNQNKIFIDLPDSVFIRIEETIQRCVAEALQKHVDAIKAEPDLLTREQTAKRLRISLPTLREKEKAGLLIPQRCGRKLLYDRRAIEEFLRR